MAVKLLTKPYLEFLSLKSGCTGSSESTLVKMPHCWKSHVAAHLSINNVHFYIKNPPKSTRKKYCDKDTGSQTRVTEK